MSSDQEALTLHQVKTHGVSAFAASKAFQSGVSLEQILLACHWKSHEFSLKDVAWADSELFHLGPVKLIFKKFKKKLACFLCKFYLLSGTELLPYLRAGL